MIGDCLQTIRALFIFAVEQDTPVPGPDTFQISHIKLSCVGIRQPSVREDTVYVFFKMQAFDVQVTALVLARTF